MSRAFYRNRLVLGAIPQIPRTYYGASLLHMNGDNESTTFTDVSGKIWTPNGNAKLSTSSPKFGTACGTFAAATDYISTPANTDFNLATNNFTIDFWCIVPDAVTNVNFYKQRLDGDNYVAISRNMTYGSWFYAELSNTQVIYCLAGNLKSIGGGTAWTHIAVTRSGSAWKFFAGGVDQTTSGSTSSATVPYFASTDIIIGEQTSGTGTVKLDEFRILNGEAIWTSNFSVPTAEY
jgi:hypothetical protein